MKMCRSDVMAPRHRALRLKGQRLALILSDHIHEYWNMCEKHSAEAVEVFMDWGGEKLEHFEGYYMGEYDSEEDYARQFVDECYDL